MNTPHLFDCFCDTYKPLIESRLLSELIFSFEDPRTVLEEAMRYSLSAKAKRIRPLIILAVFFLYQDSIEKIMPVVVATEMIHTYSLIHDDLPAMDNDDYRRGQLTCHKKFGEDVAILAGDTLNTLAFEILATQLPRHYSAEATIKTIQLLSKACGVHGMSGGQVLDLFGAKHTHNATALEQIHRLKTGAMIHASVMIPAFLECSDNTQLHYLDQFGHQLGLLFQIVDDILDVVGEQELLGKTIGKDLAQNKLTYVHFYGLEEAKKMAKKELEKARKTLEALNTPSSALLLDLLQYIGNRKL